MIPLSNRIRKAMFLAGDEGEFPVNTSTAAAMVSLSGSEQRHGFLDSRFKDAVLNPSKAPKLKKGVLPAR